jgi:hypothetical protein
MRNRVAVVSLMACGVWSIPAAAQYELGAGDVLDANTGSAYGGVNLPAAVPDFRSRNLLITGNVVGGRGFRGTVGYTADYDFRSELGSNDLFLERATSGYSSPRLLEASRTVERLRFGQYLGNVEYRRAGRGASLATLGEQRFVPQRMIDDRLNLDDFSISSTTSAIYEARADGRIVGLLRDAEGQQIVAHASSLFGVQMTPAEEYGQLRGLTSYDVARLAQDEAAGRFAPALGQPFKVGLGDLRRADQRRGAEPVTGRVEPQIVGPALQPAYREILERVEQRYAAARPAPPEGEPRPPTTTRDEFERLRELLGGTAAPDAGEDAGLGRPRLPADLEELAGPLRHGARVDHLTAAAQNRFDELLASGEQKLRDGEYFWAERRFERALRFTPGHPLATAGKGHAQIGAGLYAPAAMTLHRLLTENPEMIDVRYEQSLLPGRVRLGIAVDRLRQLVAEQRDRALHAFLLAYIGHQLDRPDLVREGLQLMGASSPDDPLHAVLQEVWLADSDGG